MPPYHFDIHNDIDVPDEQGSEHPHLAAVKEQAISGARGTMADHVTSGRPIHLHHQIEITDESGKAPAVIPFRELLTLVD